MTDAPLIYVVDDDAEVRESLAVLLDSVGYSCSTFATGAAFLEALGPERPGCVLLDVRMPGKSGLHIQEILAGDYAWLPVIIITGHGDVPMAVAAMKGGAFDFIEKPYREETLLESLDLALQHGRSTKASEAEARMMKARFESLTPRESDVLGHLVAGRPNKVIGYELGISPRTVEIHRARVMEKTGARSLSELVRMAMTLGLTPRLGSDAG